VGDQVLLGLLPEGPPTHHLKKEKKTVRAFRRGRCNYYFRVWSQPAHITRTGARVCGLVDSLLGTIPNLPSPTYTHTHTQHKGIIVRSSGNCALHGRKRPSRTIVSVSARPVLFGVADAPVQ
jgi:hypothetical protein